VRCREGFAFEEEQKHITRAAVASTITEHKAEVSRQAEAVHEEVERVEKAVPYTRSLIN
jgi:hypothetical protein